MAGITAASLFIHPAPLPHSAIVEAAGDRQQTLPEEVETPPNQQDANGALRHAQHADERPPLRERHPGEFLQARGADDAFLMFRDALAAVELTALRAAGGGLAPGVVEAALMAYASHEPRIITRACKARRLSADTAPPLEDGTSQRINRQPPGIPLASRPYVRLLVLSQGSPPRDAAGFHGGPNPARDPVAGRSNDPRDVHGVALRGGRHFLGFAPGSRGR